MWVLGVWGFGVRGSGVLGFGGFWGFGAFGGSGVLGFGVFGGLGGWAEQLALPRLLAAKSGMWTFRNYLPSSTPKP